MSLPKGVYRKDDRVKLKRKDSDHTRCSKQNTYHVANKNIAPSKVTNDERGDAFRGIPKLRLFGVLGFYLGVPWASPSLGSCHSLFRSPSNLYPKTWKLHNTKLKRKSSRAPLVKENKPPLQGTVMNSFLIYISVKPTVFQLPYGAYPYILAIDASK